MRLLAFKGRSIGQIVDNYSRRSVPGDVKELSEATACSRDMVARPVSTEAGHGERVNARVTVTAVELFFRGRQVASHRRSYGPNGTQVTNEAHRPKNHQQYGSWPPERMISWAETIGPNAAKVVAAIMAARPHPEQGYRSCQALIRDSKRFGTERTEAACARALQIGNPTRKTVISILRRGLDQQPLEDPEPKLPLVAHKNVRGGEYFNRCEEQT